MVGLSRFNNGTKPRLRSSIETADAERSDTSEPSSFARKSCVSSDDETSSTACISRISSLSSTDLSFDIESASNGNHRQSGENRNPLGLSSSSSSSSSSMLRNVLKTLTVQTRGLTKEFRSNGLPWKGKKCRSILAGGSGVLYCLPALVCQSNPFEQCTWIAQGILSVIADYFFMDRDSLAHGIDRISATTLFVSMTFRAVTKLRVTSLVLSIVPFFAFVLANRAKQKLDLQLWIYCHFLWHLTSSISTTIAIYLLYNCPENGETVLTNGFLQNQFCLNAL